ncbi:hypothetical protein GCM10027160_18300 [Streptomyces calidiresistens]|uniref:Uncharacterized protein n=1 Tax=Streptomyces calidiresistens TaxID=1485586 RepID=A0A7W3XV67_9ACTN|nr:hypothetical protein [Streptomyces calidiresistens]MBB0228412.1 hypothetical protein [Streptomyces calidiresistens]
MEWLLTVPADTDRAVLAELLVEAGCVLHDLPAVPMGEGEQVVYARGPEDIEARLRARGLTVTASPNSSMRFFET